MKLSPTRPEVYWQFRPSHTHVWEWLIDWRLSTKWRVLDVGCGPGVEANALTQSTRVEAYVGVDIAYDAVAHAKRIIGAQEKYSFVVAAAEKLPFGGNSFDLITFFVSLHQIDDPRIALHEAVRVMSRSGSIGVLLVEECDWQESVEYECFPGLKEIERAKSGRVNVQKVETWFSEMGFATRYAKFEYLKQHVNQEFLEACKNMYFSSLKRLDRNDFEKGIRCLEKRVASSGMETRSIFCTVLQGSKK